MMRSLTHARTGRGFTLLAAAFSATFSLFGPGCVVQPPGGGDGGTDNGDLAGSIISPTSNLGVSELDALPISVIYSVTGGAPDNIDGYVVEVADANPGSPAVRDRVVVATDIEAGANQNFSFVPAAAGSGFFRVGVLVSQGTAQTPFESTAVIQVQGAPDPEFILPIGPVAIVERGSPIQVKFDAGDPENDVQWRLFFIATGDSLTVPPDQLGTQIGPLGTGNLGDFLLQTVNLDPGDYKVGLSATDSGDSIPQTVANGETSRIVTIPSDSQTTPIVRVVAAGTGGLSPTIAFTAPGATDVSLYLNPTFNVQFAVTIREPGVTGTIDVFYDRDRNAENGYTIISQDLAASTTAVALPANLPEGTHNIGIIARDGINNPVTSYAQGRVIFTKTPTLDVSAPNLSTAVRPGTEVDVKWTTNATANSGTAEVFYHRLTAAGLPDPNAQDVFILQNAPMATTSAKFSSAASGQFRITVRLNFTAKFCVGGTNANNPCTAAGECPGGACNARVLTDDAPQPVRVTSLPQILWLGTLATAAPAFEGAIFGGVNFEDNAGSAFAPAGDLDGDGLADFIIAARYGKPYFINPTGVGPGEAYAIYGSATKRRGLFNLNSVGTESLRGLTFVGIRTLGDSGETDGLSDVLLIPDTDGDSRGEIAFGFPKTLSACPRFNEPTRELCLPGAFLGGGAVIVSSRNSQLRDPTANATMNLNDVGQRFSDETAQWQAAAIVDDQLVYEEGDQDADPPVEAGCADGTDNINDTVTGPSEGFAVSLANPAWVQLALENPMAFPFYGAEVVEGDEVCHSRVDETLTRTCWVDGVGQSLTGLVGGLEFTLSSFYPATAQPREPFGARILGQATNDRFGTTISASTTRGVPGPGNLLISAPGASDQAGNGSGIVYIPDNRHLWGRDSRFATGALPPFPHMYTIDEVSHCSGSREKPLIDLNRVVGDDLDEIDLTVGIDDFNSDDRGDIAVGAPQVARLYIAYRRDRAVEGDFFLSKLEFANNNVERLDGLLVLGTTNSAFGFSIASGFDFNDDGKPDVVVGAPTTANGVGEVIVIFGGTGVASDLGGLPLNALLTTTVGGTRPAAARITGNTRDANGRFGYNVANAGDLDGDGTNDLLIAAPNGTPRFDSNPSDATDVLATQGIDQNGDGQADPVPGDETLVNAGLVYLIYGNTRLDQVTDFKICSSSGVACSTDAQCGSGQTCKASKTINIEALGGAQLDGLILAGRRDRDRLGGGDAGDTAFGGITAKQGRGRSFGLSTAGDVDGDGKADILIGATMADPRRDPNTGIGVQNGGEVYLVYSSALD